jgi:hypothetical protein
MLRSAALFCACVAIVLALVPAPVSAMQFQLLQSKGQRMVLATGEIVAGDAAKLERALKLATRGQNRTKDLLLDSPGGLVREAFAMANVMDIEGVSTVVPANAVCASACASVLFVSGRYRSIEKGGALLIHSCFDGRDGSEVEFCNALISEHAQYEGASGLAMMALQQAAGTNTGFLIDGKAAACLGLISSSGRRAAAVPPCLRAAMRHPQRRR